MEAADWWAVSREGVVSIRVALSRGERGMAFERRVESSVLGSAVGVG